MSSPHEVPSYLTPPGIGAWGVYLEQIDRVTPYLGSLARWVETMKRPKRILIVDVPIERDDGTVAHFEGYRVQHNTSCLLYTSPSPRDRQKSRMPSSA